MATTPVFLRGNPMDRGAWWATAHGVQTQLSTHTDNKSYKGHPGSWNWTWRGGSGFRLSTVLKAVSFCQSALLPLQADFPDGHTMAAMCLLIWICFCSAFQWRILRPTLIRVLLDIVLLQHSHPICQNGSAFKSYPVSTAGFILSPSPLQSLLPTTNTSPGLLESSPNWSPPLLLLLTLQLKPERYLKNVSQITSRLRIFQLLPISLE